MSARLADELIPFGAVYVACPEDSFTTLVVDTGCGFVVFVPIHLAA